MRQNIMGFERHRGEGAHSGQLEIVATKEVPPVSWLGF